MKYGLIFVTMFCLGMFLGVAVFGSLSAAGIGGTVIGAWCPPGTECSTTCLPGRGAVTVCCPVGSEAAVVCHWGQPTVVCVDSAGQYTRPVNPCMPGCYPQVCSAPGCCSPCYTYGHDRYAPEVWQATHVAKTTHVASAAVPTKSTPVTGSNLLLPMMIGFAMVCSGSILTIAKK